MRYRDDDQNVCYQGLNTTNDNSRMTDTAQPVKAPGNSCAVTIARVLSISLVSTLLLKKRIYLMLHTSACHAGIKEYDVSMTMI